jgi:hypothetical protein
VISGAAPGRELKSMADDEIEDEQRNDERVGSTTI